MLEEGIEGRKVGERRAYLHKELFLLLSTRAIQIIETKNI
jgi:hypothetical protein